MTYNLKHTGAEIDAQIDRVIDGSAFAEELAKRGYIFKGVATADTVPDNTPMSFYLTYGVGKYPNFFGSGSTNLAKGLYAFVYDGTHWEYRIISTDIIYEAKLEAILARYATKENLSTELSEVEARVNTRTDSEILKAKTETKQILSATEREIYEEVDKKANNNEYYPAMAVGIADNLRGRGEATDTQFTYRPSAGAGNSIVNEGVATMKRIKGNAVVWNQLFKNGNAAINGGEGTLPEGWSQQNWLITTRSTITYPSTGGIDIVCTTDNPASGNVFFGMTNIPTIPSSHKILCTFDYSLDGVVDNYSVAIGGHTGDQYRSYLPSTNGDKVHKVILGSYSVNLDAFVIQFPRGIAGGEHLWLNNLKLYDLTKMFGSGNEPATEEEFYERIPTGIDANAYNGGELIPVNTESIETVGFNQWDEVWANGYIDVTPGSNGTLGSNPNRVVSRNFCDCIPDGKYYINAPTAINIIWFTAEKKVIRHNYTSGLVTAPYNAAYFKINTQEDYGTTYNNNICINLSHSGVENGRYEKYVKGVIELPEIAQCFPDGLKSAGAVFDEINETQAIKRVGVVDLRGLNWMYGNLGGETPVFFASVLDVNIKVAPDLSSIANMLCAQYTTTSANAITNTSIDKAIATRPFGSVDKYVVVADTSYTDVESFKNAMSGVQLYFELTEPEIIELPQRAINLNYPVWDWGTERAVSSKPSAPFRADTIYGFNAVDTIRTNKSTIEKLLQRVAELEARIPSAEAPVTEE